RQAIYLASPRSAEGQLKWEAQLALKRLIAAGAAGLAALIMPAVAFAQTAPVPTPPDLSKIDSGDTAWVLVSAAMVMLMTPGLGFFYGGLVRKKNVLSTIFYSFLILPLI